jgi:acyl-CoA synthetase (AMP-forming)/AMP-acid ligase II
MLQWACASIGAILVTMNPAYRINELVSIVYCVDMRGIYSRSPQAAALNLAGVAHFFLVPHIRSSSYIKMLSEKFPALRNSTPGDIQEPALPELHNLIVFDNTGEFPREAVELDFECWTDWREILVWDEAMHERKLQSEISISLEKDEVINLQFTRY